jgi:hypothetical protein
VKPVLYTVKSKKDMTELIEILKEEGISLTHENPFAFEVTTEKEKDCDVFSNILAFFVGYLNFKEQLAINFVKKGLPKDEADQLVDEAVFNLKNTNYFYTLTRVLVKEYFKKMQTFNMDSFALFNMKGFKEEVKHFAEETIRFQSVSMGESSPFDQLDGETELSDVGMKDLFTILRDRAVENGLKVEDFKDVHIYQQGEYLLLKNTNGVVLDDNFFLDYLGSALQFEVMEKVDNPELFEGMMVSSVVINIFDVKKIVIHKSLTDKAKEVLLFNLTALKKETGKRIKVIDCNGCDHCK